MNDIDTVLRRNNLLDSFRENAALLLWDEVIGERLGRYTRSAFVRDRVLAVHVSSATVAHELTLLKGQLLAKLNARLAPYLLQDIRFIQRAIPRPPAPILLQHVQEHQKDAYEMFSDMPDRKLAEQFERLVASQKDRETSLLASGGHHCPQCGAVYLGDSAVCPGCRYDVIDAEEESH